jgi:rhamnosyltransferase
MTGSGATNTRVFAIVVTYLPQARFLSELIAALAPQVERILVVDNTPGDDGSVEQLLSKLALPTIDLLRQGANLGIAKALNIGIECAARAGATHVLLSDQDSLPMPDMVAGLLRALGELTARGERIGAVGATFTDLHTGITFPFQVEIPGKFFYGHARADAEHPLVEVLGLITSGTLAPIGAFSEVGLMREELFIDKVDIEWCHRARASGSKLFGTSYATMLHRLGDAHLRVWYFGWRNESAYSPVRVYYQVRNFIALCKMPYISWRWKVRNGWFTFGVMYSQVFFGDDRKRSWTMALRGLWDGVRGKMGPLAG